jgi:hypothetical protein
MEEMMNLCPITYNDMGRRGDQSKKAKTLKIWWESE